MIKYIPALPNIQPALDKIEYRSDATVTRCRRPPLEKSTDYRWQRVQRTTLGDYSVFREMAQNSVRVR